MKRSYKLGLTAIAAAAVVLIVAAIIAAIPSCDNRIYFSVSYYFVCYKSADDAHSAASVSSTVQSYGGAGYIIKIGTSYYVTVACYYNEEDAQSVCSSLGNEGLSCRMVEALTEEYKLPASLSQYKSNIHGALTALDQLGIIFYQTANSLDSGEISTSAAQSVLDDACSTLCGLLKNNQNNALHAEIEYLIALVDDISGSYIYAREIRALQVAVCDAILNVNFN